MVAISRPLVFVIVALLMASGLAGLITPRLAVAKDEPAGPVADQYIVRLRDGVDPATKMRAVERRGGVARRHLYQNVMNGFSAQLSEKRIAELRSDPDVLSIVQDFAIGFAAETIPAGLKRVDANNNAYTQIDRNSNPVDVDAGVAIVDSGIDLDHPDLNVVGGVNCATDGTSADDLNGHGTHVAGTVGARDNDIGVVGIAPGVRLYAIRVLSAAGEGEFSNAICGMEWILAHADEIDVVNMSLGGIAPEGDCNDGSLHQAICEVIAAGITVVVAAGNGGEDAVGDDAAEFAPASFDEVITVSAIVDTNGTPGGGGWNHFFWGPDDSLARFSNFGADVDIAAPGVSILSTWPGGGQNYSDGTSMAAPHVAGAAAIVRAMNPGMSPDDVRNEIMAVAWPQSAPEGFTGDSDGYAEPLLNVGALGGDPLPPPAPVCTMNPLEGSVTTKVEVACANFQPNEFVRVYWDDPTTSPRTSLMVKANGAGTGIFSVPSTPAGEHLVIFRGVTSQNELVLPFIVKPSVAMTPESVVAGNYASFRLRGFGAGEQVQISLAGQSTTLELATVTVAADGSALKSVRMPFTPGGDYLVTATGSTTGETAETTATIKAAMTPASVSARVGNSVKLTLVGFQPGENVALTWYDDDVATPFGSVVTSPDGSGTITIVVPQTVRGAHALTATGDQGTTLTSTVNVMAAIKLPSAYTTVGGTLTIVLTGFSANEDVTVNWFTTTSTAHEVAVVTVDETGAGTFSVVPPESTQGTHKVQAVSESSGPSVFAYAMIQPSVVINPALGPSGTEVTAVARGFRSNETVTIRWYRTNTSYTLLTSAPASETGSATITFTVPANQTLGNHKVVGYGSTGHGQGTAWFTVE